MKLKKLPLNDIHPPQIIVNTLVTKERFFSFQDTRVYKNWINFRLPHSHPSVRCTDKRDNGKLIIVTSRSPLLPHNREFKKLLRRRQRERHKTIGFNEKTKALHVRFKVWYIYSP